MIQVSIDANELSHERAEKLKEAIEDNDHFEFVGFADLISDVQFRKDDSYFYAELKEPADFVSSVLSGHLFSQVLALQEAQMPAMVIILGDDTDVSAAIKKATTGRKRDRSAKNLAITYSNLVMSFESDAYDVGIPCLRFKNQPWKRLLSHAHKILEGNNLIQHRPKPADGEREIFALCSLIPGIGPIRAKAILNEYEGSFSDALYYLGKGSTDEEAFEILKSIPGIGPKTAEMIRKSL